MAERSAGETARDQPSTGASSRSGAARMGASPSGGMAERINAAYASSAPVLPDETQRKPSGAERLAAALTGSRTKSPAPPPAVRPAARPVTKQPARTRRARLRLTHIDPWSVMKTAFLLSVALGIVVVVAVAVVWWVLDAAGVWTSIDQAVSDVVGETSNGFRIEDYIGLSRVLGFAMLVAVVDVVLVTVIATLTAFLYNLAAALLGGLEVVLAEEDQ